MMEEAIMAEAESQTPQSYSQEDIQHILQLALARKTDREELSREQLWELASELDIDYSALQEAEQEWLLEKENRKKREDFAIFRRSQLKHKLVRYVIVNSFLVLLNWLSSGTLSWSIYVLLIWGLGVSLEGWKTWQTEGEEYEQAFQRWKLKNDFKESMISLWDKIKRAWQS
jgi:hypothetical protein